jgi:hypothetical protein
MLILPVFFFAFMLIYRPYNIMDFFGNDWFGVHITIISSIILISMVITRLLYYFLPLKLTYTLYTVWCLAEVVFVSFFAALYLWLVLDKPMSYFDTLALSFQYVCLTLLIPYVILALSLRIHDFITGDSESDSPSSARMRFYDEKHNLKIVLSPQSVLYIEADINYVKIYYTDGGKLRCYVLRNSMKAIDELCQEHGLLRCQRSFYVNPKHVKVLRKEKEGVIYAELDVDDAMHIPVTKRYYERLAEMLY